MTRALAKTPRDDRRRMEHAGFNQGKSEVKGGGRFTLVFSNMKNGVLREVTIEIDDYEIVFLARHLAAVVKAREAYAASLRANFQREMA